MISISIMLKMHRLFLLLLSALLFTLAQTASTITFYSDNKCEIAIHNATGPIDGTCTQFSIPDSAYSSYMLTSIDATCAVTIYFNDIPYCSSSTTAIASLGQCFRNYTEIEYNQFSVDCEDINAATSAPPTLASTMYGPGTPTASLLPTATSVPPNRSGNDLSRNAKIGIGVGVSFAGLFILCLGIHLLRINNRRRHLVLQHEHNHQYHQPPTYISTYQNIEDEKDAPQGTHVSELMGNHYVEIHSSPRPDVPPYQAQLQEQQALTEQRVFPPELESAVEPQTFAWPWLTETKYNDRDGNVYIEQGRENRISRCVELDGDNFVHAKDALRDDSIPCADGPDIRI